MFPGLVIFTAAPPVPVSSFMFRRGKKRLWKRGMYGLAARNLKSKGSAVTPVCFLCISKGLVLISFTWSETRTGPIMWLSSQLRRNFSAVAVSSVIFGGRSLRSCFSEINGITKGREGKCPIDHHLPTWDSSKLRILGRGWTSRHCFTYSLSWKRTPLPLCYSTSKFHCLYEP